MPKLLTQSRLRKSLRKVSAPQTGWLDIFVAITGRADGTVLTGIPGVIYVRNILNGQVLAVYNGIVSNRPNVQVEVGRRVDQPGLWRIKGEAQVFSQPPTGDEIGIHAPQHQFPHGSDIGFWDRKQVLAMDVLVLDGANFIVRVYGGYYPTASGLAITITQDMDLSSYVVGAGAKYVSIEADDSGALSIHDGTVFDAPAIATIADIPAPDPGKQHVASVLLFAEQPELLNEHIRVPMPLGVIAKATGLQINEAAADTPLDADKFGFWDMVDAALKSITWANIKAIFDGLYSALGHTHSYLPSTADYDDISANDAATDVTGAELEELTDGSTTTLHTHDPDDIDDSASTNKWLTAIRLSALIDSFAATSLSNSDKVPYRQDASGDMKEISWQALKIQVQALTDALYAPIAKGVTNGDSHNHTGGDGADLDSLDIIYTPTGDLVSANVQDAIDELEAEKAPIATTREKLTAARTYYVRTDGNDSNTGLANTAGGAFLTIQKAVDTISGLDINGQTTTVQIADGTYTGTVTLKNVTGFAVAGNLVIQGNNGTPANVHVNVTGTAFAASNLNVVWDIKDLKITCTNISLYAKDAYLRYSNLDFAAATGAHIYTDVHGKIEATGNYAVSGNSPYHWIGNAPDSVINTAGMTITFSNSPVFTTFCYGLMLAAFFVHAMTFTNGGTVTGKRYQSDNNSVIYTGGGGANYLPGNAGGTTDGFGVYL